ncbi:MAG: UvrD-helicase domain-containing protein, partial [Burkholderiaceae bacterium]|nr:UvrD-helicase domain-containing protein [Burkholderiaceae bacterium]
MATTDNLDVFACPLEGMSLIEASAGTGKTWNICALYLRLLLETGRTVPQILVVTFTTAATAELKERIRQRIADTLFYLESNHAATREALIRDDPFLEMLESRMKPHGAKREAMAGALRAALASFDEAAIFTIHGFCQKALALKAFSAGQIFSGEVEPDDTEIAEEVAHDFWRRHIASGETPRPLLMYLTAKRVTPDRLRDFLLRELKKPLAERRWPEGMESMAAHDFPALNDAFALLCQSWEKERDTIGKRMADAAAQGDLKSATYSPKRIEEAFNEYAALFQAEDALALNLNDECLARLTTGRLQAGTRAKGNTPLHPFFDLAGNWISEREATLAKLDMAYRLLLCRLAEEADEVRRRKREKRVISYDDMLYNLYAALMDKSSQRLPDAIRQTWTAALIDEFQDTDPVQFAIFNTLYAKSNLPAFLVGDPKQAIYSFRNADLHTYLQAKNIVSRHYPLTHNQRSTPRLIAACNALFMQNPCAFMQEGLDYQQVSAGERKREPLTDKTLSGNEEPDGMVLWQLPTHAEGDTLLRAEALQAAAHAVAAEVARLITAGSTGNIRIGDKNLGASDIAVLVRSHREGGIIREALANQGISSVSLSQESIWHSPDAAELSLVLAAMLRPANRAHLRAALATEMLGFDSAAILALEENGETGLNWLENFAGYLAAWRDHGIASALKQLLAELNVWSRLLKRPDGERRLTNLTHLTELLNEAEQTHTTPETLVRWFNLQITHGKSGEDTQLRLESDERLVQILTIHSAKGLEFPVVLCPFLWDAFQRNASGTLPGFLYHDKETLVMDYRPPEGVDTDLIRRQQRDEQAAESLRLLYVALTRAVYRCYLVVGGYARKTRGAPSL